MARSRAKEPSLEEMLQPLKTSFRGRLAPPLGGFVYRFTLFLPILSEGHAVFSDYQRELLADLFHVCMRGFTETASESNPPWYGSWAPPGSVRPVIDCHTLMVVYTPQINTAKEFFSQLRWILERKHVANQDVVLIEHTTAWLVEPRPPA
jgi:hypothetical protein